MELVLKGRGDKISDQIRAVAEHKLERLGRLEHEVTRCEVEITHQKNPRLGGAHHVEASLDTPRKTFRAEAVQAARGRGSRTIGASPSRASGLGTVRRPEASESS